VFGSSGEYLTGLDVLRQIINKNVARFAGFCFISDNRAKFAIKPHLDGSKRLPAEVSVQALG
jgi:hypothetical protein